HVPSLKTQEPCLSAFRRMHMAKDPPAVVAFRGKKGGQEEVVVRTGFLLSHKSSTNGASRSGREKVTKSQPSTATQKLKVASLPFVCFAMRLRLAIVATSIYIIVHVTF
ncbi:hypothetical protein A4X03_0g9827, partial [Tilletia caries]